MIDLVALIDRWAERSPDRIAHVSRDHKLTFGELRERSDALACHLARQLDRGVPIVIHGHKQPDMLVGFVAAHVGSSFTAIAIAWAIGYPIAFAVLWATVLGELRLGLVEYIRRVGRIPVLIALATAAAAGVHLQLGSAGAGVRLAITAAVVLVVGVGLLAWRGHHASGDRAIAAPLRSATDEGGAARCGVR